MTEAEQIMKQCQVGTRTYEEANNLHAACYGIIGKLLAQQEKDYERGFVDGMQKQMQSSVDKAVNRMAQTQEPVAWMFQHDETGRMNYVSNDGIHNPTMFLEINPRYAVVCPLYTTPPQRTWVGLTIEEIASCCRESTTTQLSFYNAIEAKLKEKNT